MAAGVAIGGHRVHLDAVTVIGCEIVLIGGAAAAFAFPWFDVRWAAPAVSMTLFLVVLVSSPSWNRLAYLVSDRDEAHMAAALLPPDGEIYALGLKHTSLVYYSDRHVIYSDDRVATMQRIHDHPGGIYAMQPKSLRELVERYGLREYRVLAVNRRLVMIQA